MPAKAAVKISLNACQKGGCGDIGGKELFCFVLEFKISLISNSTNIWLIIAQEETCRIKFPS
jgi:hypothetical protein